MITVRIIAQTFEGAQVLETEATSWGQLKSEVANKIGSINDMKPIAKWNAGRAVLELDETPLPNEDFTLYLTPKKVKSGVDLPYKECRAFIKSACNDGTKEQNAAAKAHFGNYTHMRPAEMNKLIATWQGSESTTTTVTEVIEKVVEPVKQSIETKSTDITEEDVRRIVLDILIECDLIDPDDFDDTVEHQNVEVESKDPRTVISDEERRELQELKNMR